VKRVIIYTFYRGMSTIYKIIPLFDYYLLIGCCASLYILCWTCSFTQMR